MSLAIAQQITLAHQGTIHVESTQGVGTTFTVRLPQAEAAAGQGHRNVACSCRGKARSLYVLADDCIVEGQSSPDAREHDGGRERFV